MARAYDFEDGNGNSLLPIADASFTTARMGDSYSKGECFVAFYDADGETLVTPTAGTVTFQSAGIEGQWLDAPSGTTIDATTVGTAYTPPSFNSRVVRSRMTLSGITGATYVQAIHWRGN